jgi:hypothetical protein
MRTSTISLPRPVLQPVIIYTGTVLIFNVDVLFKLFVVFQSGVRDNRLPSEMILFLRLARAGLMPRIYYNLKASWMTADRRLPLPHVCGRYIH